MTSPPSQAFPNKIQPSLSSVNSFIVKSEPMKEIGKNAIEHLRTLTCQTRNTVKDFTFLAKINHFYRERYNLYGINYTFSALLEMYSEINAKPTTVILLLGGNFGRKINNLCRLKFLESKLF